MQTSKITVVDSIMGSGKTSAMINHINSHSENNYIFITPFLAEVQRIKDSTICYTHCSAIHALKTGMS